MICSLCKKNEANQTGSHITSAFLLTSQIGKRGKEKVYLITTNPDQDYSKNRGDAEIKEDFLFCRNCEKRLSVIESIYANEITNKIEQKQFETNFDKTDLGNEKCKLNCKRVHPISFQLLLLSNIWRASISEKPLYRHFNLKKDLEERIRFNLDLFLPEIKASKLIQTENVWIKMIESCKELFDIIPIAIYKAENIENKEMTYEFFDNLSKLPYHIILNEYLILLFDNKLNWEDDFFDLRNETDLGSIINDNVDKSIICVISNERYFQTLNKIKDLAVDQRLEEIEIQSINELLKSGKQINSYNIRQLLIENVNKIKI